MAVIFDKRLYNRELERVLRASLIATRLMQRNSLPLTRWQKIKKRFKYRIRNMRERLGEIIAGKRFDE